MIEVVVVLLFAIAWVLLWRSGRKIGWPRETKWRNTLFVLGWIIFAIAVLLWAGLLVVVINALRSAVETNLPKKPSLILVFIGGFAYFTLIGFAASAFQACHGSARNDIMKKLGR